MVRSWSRSTSRFSRNILKYSMGKRSVTKADCLDIPNQDYDFVRLIAAGPAAGIRVSVDIMTCFPIGLMPGKEFRAIA